MTTIDDFQKLTQEKASENIEEAFEFLAKNINSYTLNGRNLVMIKSRYKYLKQNRLTAGLSFAEEIRHFTSILDSLLQLISICRSPTLS